VQLVRKLLHPEWLMSALPLTIVRGGNTLFTDVNKEPSPQTSSAIRALEARRAELELEIRELEDSIAVLRGSRPEREVSRYPAVRPGQYAGMKRSEALRAYLNERPGGVIFTKALNDLLLGGMEKTKTPRDNRRYLTTTITQNPDLFERDPNTDEVRLKAEKKK
jgi:hypothetical protein